MSTNVEENNTDTRSVIPTPYSKEPREVVEEAARGLEGANDSLAVVRRNKTVYSDPYATEQEAPQESKQEEQKPVTTDTPPKKYEKDNYEKRYGDLRRYTSQKENEWKNEKQQLEAKLAAFEAFQAPKTPDELEAFKEEHRDVYDMMETIAYNHSSKQTERLATQLEQVNSKLAQSEMEKAMVELRILVPDIDEVTGNDDFHTWAESQPQQIKDWIYNNPNNASLAAKAINLYKLDVGNSPTTVDKKEERPTRTISTASAADAVSPKARVEEPTSKEKIWSRAEIQGMDVRDFEKYASEIDKAFLEGRVR